MAKVSKDDFQLIRDGLASIPSDVSSDAVGSAVPKLEDIFAPQNHAAALDPATAIVVGARGTGKSFWSGVLGQQTTRSAAATAYPNLRLDRTSVEFGFTGIGGPRGTTKDTIDKWVSGENRHEALVFWWATILRASEQTIKGMPVDLSAMIEIARDSDARDRLLSEHDEALKKQDKLLLVVFDALDTVAYTWPRRRILTIALLEVVWSMRAFRSIHAKLFLRGDQIDDDGLQFVELPKLRAGAVKLVWLPTDLYGLLFSRLALSVQADAKAAFGRLLTATGAGPATLEGILTRKWSILTDSKLQAAVMGALSGPYMAAGPHGYKKGKTYDWPIKHLADAFNEVTPRSFLELMISAAKIGQAPNDKSITPEGIRHGLRAASKTRVDQLHQEFPWIKGVLAPLDGLLLPAKETNVFRVWAAAKTTAVVIKDAEKNEYLPPFTPSKHGGDEKLLYEAMRNIGVMARRKDGRLDMPDLFRVAANLLKKGGTTPIG
ncbi:hypothetical protein ACQR1V_01760 [Bradyrhizobium oligotrophicum]|uniref:hypothetical protein n=1 Tax=Bradyrhizobium oligotrophicum TaxID=44255 RepID=UPI003EBCE7CA